MKRFVIFFLFTSPLFIAAQQRDIYDTVSEKVCEYLNQHGDIKITTQKQAEEFFSEAFVAVAMPMLDRLLEKEGIEDFDNAAGQVIGKKVGVKLAVNCPRYLEIMKPVIKDASENSSETGILKGTVTEIVQDIYTYLKIKSADGSLKRVVWLTNFEESENFNNDPQKLVSKKVEVKWTATKLFHYKSKSYADEKVISSIKMN